MLRVAFLCLITCALVNHIDGCSVSDRRAKLTLDALETLTYIESPNYPSTYVSQLACEWLFKTNDPIYRIFIDIRYLNIEAGPGCSYDSLTIYDGPTTASTRLFNGCGRQNTGSIHKPNSNEVLIKMKSDASVQFKGFELRLFKYKRDVTSTNCAQSTVTLTSNAAAPSYLVTPGFPVVADGLRQCTWLIQTSSPGNALIIELVFMDIDCPADNLRIYDGGDSTAPKLVDWCYTRISFGKTQVATNSTGSSVFLEFDIAATGRTRTGFVILYNETTPNNPVIPETTIPPLPTYSSCGSGISITASPSPQLLTSPDYAEYYGNLLDCVWTITAPEGDQVYLTIIDLLLEVTAECKSDRLSIYDGSSASFPLLGKYCGYTTGQLNSTGRSLHIVFHSDDSVANRGFKFQFVSDVHETPGCVPMNNNTVNLTSNYTIQYFSSPMYPTTYQGQQTFIWIIHNPSGSGFIKLQVVDTRVEASYRCVYDKVVVYKGPCTSYPVLGSFCGQTAPTYYNDAGNYVLVVFTTDSSVTFKGFKVSYVLVSEIPKDDITLLMILGIVLGVIFGLLALIFISAFIFIYIKRRQRAAKEEAEMDEDTNDTIHKMDFITAGKLLSLTPRFKVKVDKPVKPVKPKKVQ